VDRDELQRLIDEGLTLREMADRVGRSMGSLRYWLDRFGLKTQRAHIPRPRGELPKRMTRVCRRHGEAVFILEGRGAYRCTRCRQDRVASHRRRVKLRLVAEAGGCCALCGYDAFVGALEFHHLNPQAKSFGLAERGLTRSIETVRAEVRKCVLLCSNCHAEVEAGFRTLPSELLSQVRPADNL
jgi:5-methylcytosine-specific restriction endonuclease McrA